VRWLATFCLGRSRWPLGGRAAILGKPAPLWQREADKPAPLWRREAGKPAPLWRREAGKGRPLALRASPSCRQRLATVGLAAGLALANSGCALFHRRPPGPPPVVIVQPPILLPAPAYDAPAAPPATLTPLWQAPPRWLLALRLPRLAPPPARRNSDAAPPRSDRPQAPTANADQPPPQLTAGLSPQQQNAYRSRTLALLQRTQRELAILQQRRLSAEASATRAQAGEYVRQAQQALGQGDVVRAETLAQKAETLARFLLGG